MNKKMEDNLEMIYLKCPQCTQVSKADQWVTIAMTTTPCSASFSFMGKPKDSNSLMCPKCKQESNYLEVLEALIRDDGKQPT